MSIYSREQLQSLDDNDPFLMEMIRTYFLNQNYDALTYTNQDLGGSVSDYIFYLKHKEDSYFPLENNKESAFLSQVYVFPEGVDEQLLRKVDPDILLRHTNIYQKLLDLNPELNAISASSEIDKKNVIYGIASRFPACDIGFYIEILQGSGRNIRDSNHTFVYELQHHKLWKILEKNQIFLRTLIQQKVDDLGKGIYPGMYERIRGFENYEQYSHWMRDLQKGVYRRQKDKLFRDYYLNDNLVKRYYQLAHDNTLTNSPAIYYESLEDYISKHFLTTIDMEKNRGFGYLISPTSLYNFIEHHHITLPSIHG